MKILHTSDWHLGRSLYGKKRYKEFEKFLDWLYSTIEKEKIDTLIVSGDIFDTTTPSNQAQELYFNFLFKMTKSHCQNIIITAGNHDSPSFLNAPKQLLKAFNIFVVASISENLEDEIIVLYKNKKPLAIVCAVPYLRDKDIRNVESGESFAEKNEKLIAGIKNHYKKVCEIAEQKRKELKNDKIPIIATGHLFTSGGKTVENDGVRELYVGSLALLDEQTFPQNIDYLALGHLHIPQKVGNKDFFRYSGSPIPMGFNEAKQQKKVITIQFEELKPKICEIPVPTFQQLEKIVGSFSEIIKKIEELKEQNSDAWLEIEYTGKEIVSNLREQIEETVKNSAIEIRRIKNKQIIEKVLNSKNDNETLDDLNPKDVFKRFLETYEIAQEQKKELIDAYNQILQEISEEDKNAK